MSIGAHRFGLIPRFAVGALAVFGVVAAVLLTIMSNQLRGSQEGAAQFHAVFVTNSVLRYELAALDLRQPVSARRAAELEAFIRDRVLQYPTLRLKIWRPDGTVVFSDDFRAIGLHFTDSLRQKSLDGNTAVSEVAPPPDGSGKRVRAQPPPKLYSTYVPLHLPGTASHRPQAPVEIYQDYAGIQSAIDSVARALVFTLLCRTRSSVPASSPTWSAGLRVSSARATLLWAAPKAAFDHWFRIRRT